MLKDAPKAVLLIDDVLSQLVQQWMHAQGNYVKGAAPGLALLH